jgi:hypothetical protein
MLKRDNFDFNNYSHLDESSYGVHFLCKIDLLGIAVVWMILINAIYNWQTF